MQFERHSSQTIIQRETKETKPNWMQYIKRYYKTKYTKPAFIASYEVWLENRSVLETTWDWLID